MTLAAHWTRAGVAAVDRPLVWGPVGGAVDPPLALVGELGWRGLLEEVGRYVTRRTLARFGPARHTRHRAVFTFAQNEDTARSITTSGRLQVLSNATSIDVHSAGAPGPRRKEIFFVSRLLPWKGGQLAVRALRYVRHPDAVLRIFGDGPDRERIVRSARRWRVADRVRFEGIVRRDELLHLLSGAGVFLHPALHDEAGLAVAEALSVGTPVICLARGGPPELLRHWPDVPAAVVEPRSAETTAKAIAAAIDEFLSYPPPIPQTPHRATTSFEGELLAAYEFALNEPPLQGVGRVWGFPAGKPQVFAASRRDLSNALAVYGFGRPLPRWLHRSLTWQVRVPFLGQLVADRVSPPEPICGATAWHAILAELQRRNGQALRWIQFSSQWGKQRCSVLGLDFDGVPRVFATVERGDRNLRRPVSHFLHSAYLDVRAVQTRDVVGAAVRTSPAVSPTRAMELEEDSASGGRGIARPRNPAATARGYPAPLASDAWRLCSVESS